MLRIIFAIQTPKFCSTWRIASCALDSISRIVGPSSVGPLVGLSFGPSLLARSTRLLAIGLVAFLTCLDAINEDAQKR